MELKNLIHYFCLSIFLVTGSLFVTSCNIFDEDLPGMPFVCQIQIRL